MIEINVTCPNCKSDTLYTDGDRKFCTTCAYNEPGISESLEVLNRSDCDQKYILPYTPPNTPQDTNPYDNSFGKTGWICPKCGRGISPYTDVCPCTNYFNTIIYSSTTTDMK